MIYFGIFRDLSKDGANFPTQRTLTIGRWQFCWYRGTPAPGVDIDALRAENAALRAAAYPVVSRGDTQLTTAQDWSDRYILVLLQFTSRANEGERPGTVLQLNRDGSVEVAWFAVQQAADWAALDDPDLRGRHGDTIGVVAHALLAMRDGRVKDSEA